MLTNVPSVAGCSKPRRVFFNLSNSLILIVDTNKTAIVESVCSFLVFNLWYQLPLYNKHKVIHQFLVT